MDRSTLLCGVCGKAGTCSQLWSTSVREFRARRNRRSCLEEAPSAEDSTSRARDHAPRGTDRGDSASDRLGDRAGSAPLPLGQLRRTATPGQQSLAVALDHAGALPAPGLEDRRQLDPARRSCPEPVPRACCARPGRPRRRQEPRRAGPSSCRCAAPGWGRASTPPCRPSAPNGTTAPW